MMLKNDVRRHRKFSLESCHNSRHFRDTMTLYVLAKFSWPMAWLRLNSHVKTGIRLNVFDAFHVKNYVYACRLYQSASSMKADDLGMVVLFDSNWFEKAISLYIFRISRTEDKHDDV